MLSLYNTRTKQIEDFHPLDESNVTVRLYSCGPTVYHYVHIGNLRTFMFTDILRRTLELHGYTVNHVTNITDVGHLTGDTDDTGEDKMEKASKSENKSVWDIAKFFTEAYLSDIQKLNILPATHLVKATDHIEEQVAQVRMLIDKGYTYTTSDGIYFDTTKFPNYGELINLSEQQIEAGIRVDLGEKKHPHDFALWKFSPDGEHRQMEWMTDLGQDDGNKRPGFPGWHIECSAMAMKYLGNHIDIHTGGIDLSRVHHINEIAQAECIIGHGPWVNVWMHGEFVLLKDEKMSKSLGNVVTLNDLINDNIDPLAYRYANLQAHYRKQVSINFEALHSAQEGLLRLRYLVATLPESGTNQTFRNAAAGYLFNDLHTAEAMATLWTYAKEKQISKEDVACIDAVFALDLLKPQEMVDIPPEINALLTERAEARAAKDWEESDRLRDEIAKHGFLVKDVSGGIQELIKA